jgi:hypothetical protein
MDLGKSQAYGLMAISEISRHNKKTSAVPVKEECEAQPVRDLPEVRRLDRMQSQTRMME